MTVIKYSVEDVHYKKRKFYKFILYCDIYNV